MAWAMVWPPQAELTLRTDGVIEWNSATQTLLSNPTWVNLMWDSDSRWLGISAHSAACGGFPVCKEPERGEFKIATTAVLTELGISVNDNVSVSPPLLWENEMQTPTVKNWLEIYCLAVP